MADTEKITVNINVVDLGKIDLLVEEGFYTNRTDLIRTAIRKELHEQKPHIDDVIQRKHKVMGIMRYKAADLEKYRERGEMLEINVVGYLNIADDVTAELVEATISRVKVSGIATMPKEVNFRLHDLNRMGDGA
ncbi:MAG: CopG family transcriptional regulator [Chloroflexota bacterium]